MDWRAVLLVASILSSAASGAENINSNFCRADLENRAQRILSPAPTKELLQYMGSLTDASYAFNWTISGNIAAGQLGFGRRFAVTYDQMVEEANVRLRRNGRLSIDEVIEYLRGIIGEEQSIDRLIVERERHFPAIIYLRALQEGECSFPSVLRDTPTAQAVLMQVAQAYPELKKGFASEPFASVYNRTVAYGRDQARQAGRISIYRLVEEWRRAVLQSAGRAIPSVPATPAIAPGPPPKTPSVSLPRAPLESRGSGFFVNQEGHVLTNAHVVRDCASIAIKANDGHTVAVQLVATDENDDLALLMAGRRAERTAVLRGRPPRPGESTVVFGFPLSGVLASTGNVTTGIVTALAGLQDDPHVIQISAPVQPGNSGGPVLDASGYLIGVVVSKLDSLRMIRATRDFPQNVNFAIKASTAANFLAAHGIPYKSAPADKELPIPDIAEQARLFSVLVLCQG